MKTNKLVKFYSYIDGLKTGFTDNAGYCLTATGKKDGMRLISVVMGEDTVENRTKETVSLLDYGFNMYSVDKIFSKGEIVGNIKINMGTKENVDVVTVKDIVILNNKQSEKRNITYEIKIDNLYAPIKAGMDVGKILIYENNKYLMEVELTVLDDIYKINYFKNFLRNLRDFILLKI